jgi:hypothetical protein
MAGSWRNLKSFGIVLLILWAAGCSSYHVKSQGSSAGFSLQLSQTSASIAAGGVQPVSVTAVAANGFTGSVQVAISGLTTGVTSSPATLTLTPGAAQTVNLAAASSAVAGSATVVFTGTSGALTYTASLPLTVTGATSSTPDFSLQLNPASTTLTAGGSSQAVTATAVAANGFTGSVQVTLSGLPQGVTATPSTLTLTPGTGQQVSLSASASATTGTATVTFSGTSGSLAHTATLALTVSSGSTTPPPTSGVDVTTYHFDVARTGLNPNETTLTTSNVKSSTFGLIRSLAVDGHVDAQPLYLSGLSISGQSHNVVYVATEHDSVYAFDADSGTQLWKKSVLGTGETTSGDHGCSQITPEIGITSTPVIDRKAGSNGTIFVVGMTEDGSGHYHQRLHALDATTGAERSGSPAEISATYPGTGANSSGGNVIFDPGQYAERAGILLVNGVLYMGWTSHCDSGPYTGWLMAYNESTLAQTSVLNLTPNGSEGSIWMAGAGLAADPTGNIYFLDANGTFDTTLDANGFPANHDFGNGFIKVATAGSLSVADYFETSNTVSESSGDEDLGSGGALVLPDMQDTSGGVHHLAVGAGKDSRIYLVNRDSMGKFNATNDNAIYQEISGALGGGVFSMPAYFNNAVYYGAVNDKVKAFPIANAKLATTEAFESSNTFGYPGTTPAISANGTSNGLVWAAENNSTAVLHAYDATTLQELYNSNQAASSRDHFGNGNKFITPMVVNGKVFVGTTNSVAEFGLLQ